MAPRASSTSRSRGGAVGAPPRSSTSARSSWRSCPGSARTRYTIGFIRPPRRRPRVAPPPRRPRAGLGRGTPPRATSRGPRDRKSTRLNSSHITISYAVFCLKKKKKKKKQKKQKKKKQQTKHEKKNKNKK